MCSLVNLCEKHYELLLLTPSSEPNVGCSCNHLKVITLKQGFKEWLPNMHAVKIGMKHLLVLFLCATALCTSRCDAALAPAIFVFGDSTVDTGNQDYITSVVKSNYPPYGKDFVPPGPTGRFSNGKLANDFIAEYLGLPSPVNFMDPNATGSILLTGVNLASSGSGYLDMTGQLFGVVNLSKQLLNLGKVQQDMIQQIGQSATMDLFSKAVFMISTGSNDFINSYNVNPLLQHEYTPEAYQQHILDSINTDLQSLYDYGARKVIVNSLGPAGCTPEQLTLYQSKDGMCMDWINVPLRNFNVNLKSLMLQLRSQYPDYDLLYSNSYDLIQGLIDNYQTYGYQAATTACCGEGPYNGGPCVSPVSNVCANADDYIFWDLFHPSQKTYKALADSCWSGGPDFMFPTNLQSIL